MRSAIVASLVLAVLTACSGGGGTAPAAPTPPPSCGVPVVDAQAKLVTPASGATGVSPSIGAVTFSYSNPATPTASFVLVPSDGSAAVAASSAFAVTIVPGIWTLAIPTLKAATTYTVTGRTVNAAHAGCFSPLTVNLGSFTTQ